MESVDVAIVGGGPVGLTLACLLVQKGASVAVLEARTARSPHSRAIGLHPPAVDVLARLGLEAAIRAEAVAISGGRVFYGERLLGRLALSESPLSLPQARTEALLESRLAALAPGALRCGVKVSGVAETDRSVTLTCEGSDRVEARLAVGADGGGSFLRGAVGIAAPGGAHPDRYLLGDFEGHSEFGTDAALFFGPEGIVESFPLPGGLRRWVVRTDGDGSGAVELSTAIEARTGRTLEPEACRWISPFGIQSRIAETFLRGRIALAGDAAHVVSPIGGQGMNLGILGAAALARAWDGSPESLLEAARIHWRRAQIVRRRATFNTFMGRPMGLFSPRRALIAAALASPALSGRFARTFIMRDL